MHSVASAVSSPKKGLFQGRLLFEIRLHNAKAHFLQLQDAPLIGVAREQHQILRLIMPTIQQALQGPHPGRARGADHQDLGGVSSERMERQKEEGCQDEKPH